MRAIPHPIALMLLGLAGTVLVPGLARGETALTGTAERNQVRFELGAGGPGGVMAVRYSRVLPTKTRLEPAVGLAYTGLLGSLLVTQPLVEWPSQTRSGTKLSTSLEGYAGYSLGTLRQATRHPWTGRSTFFPHGNYHWLDLGLSIQGHTPWFIVTAGLGATVLLAGPEGIGGSNIDEETFWWIYPEGWVGKHRWGPALWSSIGWAF